MPPLPAENDAALELLAKCALIWGATERDVFIDAAEVAGYSRRMAGQHFNEHLKSGATWIPHYVISYLHKHQHQIMAA